MLKHKQLVKTSSFIFYACQSFALFVNFVSICTFAGSNYIRFKRKQFIIFFFLAATRACKFNGRFNILPFPHHLIMRPSYHKNNSEMRWTDSSGNKTSFELLSICVTCVYFLVTYYFLNIYVNYICAHIIYLPTGSTRKKGNQQPRNTPTTMANVFAAFFCLLNLAIFPNPGLSFLSGDDDGGLGVSELGWPPTAPPQPGLGPTIWLFLLRILYKI